MKTLLKVLLLGFLIFLGNDCTSGTIDPNTPDTKYIEYGKKFNCILELVGSKNNKELYTASAVAIDPHWILTAAHVVEDSRFVLVYSEYNSKPILINKVICHKEFEKDGFWFGDIALCYTESDIGLDFYPELYDQEDEVGKICSISGYGHTGTFHTGTIRLDLKRRAGSNKIDKIEHDLLFCSPSLSDRTELEFLIGDGDSGGGLFIGNRLAGINSCVTAIDKKPNSTYNDNGGHTRISKFVGWIKGNMQKKREQAKSPLP